MAIAPHDSLITALSRPGWREYLELTKPKVSLLIVFTAIVGMVLASPGMVPLPALVFGTLGIAMASGSAATLNHILDRRIDRADGAHPAAAFGDGELCGRVRPLFSRVSYVWAQ